MTGVVRETVNRILNDWKRRRVVSRLTGYYCLENRAILQKEADTLNDGVCGASCGTRLTASSWKPNASCSAKVHLRILPPSCSSIGSAASQRHILKSTYGYRARCIMSISRAKMWTSRSVTATAIGQGCM
jgi:hypothetical protein